MRHIAFEYYDNLLKAHSFSSDDLFKRDIIWSRIQHIVSVKLSECLLFFAMHNHHKSNAKIFRLKCPDGSYTNDPSKMCHIASEYYDNLLTAHSFSSDDWFKRDIIWSRIQHIVSVQPLSSQKTLKVAKALAKDVCPRLDGLVVQWYILYWEFDR